jgi:hypothetical protein
MRDLRPEPLWILQSAKGAQSNQRELATKAAIDRIHTDHLALGCRRIALLLPKELSANPHTVLKYMREMGIPCTRKPSF